MYLACLWRYRPATDDEPGFYSFAAITKEPPAETHVRAVVGRVLFAPEAFPGSG